MSILSTLKHSWNAFTSRDPTIIYKSYGPAYSINQNRPMLTRGNERSIVTSIYNRLAVDVASTTIVHAKMDDQNRFLEEKDSGLNNCLTLEANIDQTARSFIVDLVISMCDDGYVAALPVDTTLSPDKTEGYDIETMRVGEILEWFPEHVRVRAYNQKVGRKEEIVVPKRTVAIIENPFYTIMNQPNSTLQRLIRKLNILDEIDERTGSGKLDLIMQLPYTIRTQSRKDLAEERRKDIEKQLSENKYGIAYTDATEKIIQLNRPIDNKIMSQIEYLTGLLFSQLGITKEIMEGTADDKTMLNYYNRTVEPILAAIADEYKRKFLSKTARSQHQTIFFYRDPFRLVPINDIAEIADKFTRNEILTSNEVRQIIGQKPSDNPAADDLRNKNIIATEYGNVNGDDSREMEERLIDKNL